MRYPAGRVIGGGSSINGMAANRGLPSDYEAWAEAGATGWNWEGVLPFFKKLETDSDFDGPLHGRDGPIRLQRYAPERWPGFTRGVMKAIEEEGWSNIADQNARFDDGFFPVAYSHTDTMRMGAAWRYLTPEVRRRHNLTVLGGTQVDRLLFDGNRCIGVRVRGADGGREIRAREVIVSSGAIHSPVLLMRSGIGPEHELRAHGVRVVADRRGVGEHLMEHPDFGCFLKRPARLPTDLRRQMFAGLRWSSGLEGCPPGDMYVIPTNKAQWHAIGHRLGIIMMWVNRSYSTGEVRLSSAAADAPPDIDFNMCSDERDMIRIVKGVKLLAKLRMHPAVQETVEEVFPISFSDYAHKLAMYSRWNAVQTWVGAQAMDASATVRRAVIRAVIADAPSVDDLVNDEDTCRCDPLRRARPLARVLYLPDGPAGRSACSHRCVGQRDWRPRPARCRCLDHAERAVRQHQLANHHDRGEDSRHNPKRTIISGRLEEIAWECCAPAAMFGGYRYGGRSGASAVRRSGSCSNRCCGRLSEATDPDDRRPRAGQLQRYHRASRRPEAPGTPRSARRRREQAGCGRYDRCRHGRARDA